MARPFRIYALQLGGGLVGLCQLPGRDGNYLADLSAIKAWSPVLVVSLTEKAELVAAGADGLLSDLKTSGIEYRQFPVPDFSIPAEAESELWPELADQVHKHLAQGRRVLVHCMGGRGRSGMIVLRMMIENGENPEQALVRLRSARPGAVETDSQFTWSKQAQVKGQSACKSCCETESNTF